MKEVIIRRKEDEVLDPPEKIRSWVPVAVESAAARNAQQSFAEWFAQADPSGPNDKDFLARLTKLRVALHKAKHRAVDERISDVVATDRKVIVFTAFTEGLKKHKIRAARTSFDTPNSLRQCEVRWLLFLMKCASSRMTPDHGIQPDLDRPMSLRNDHAGRKARGC